MATRRPSASSMVLAPPKPKKFVAASRIRRKTKKAETRSEWERIRAKVLERADGHCECGCGGFFSKFKPPEVDQLQGGSDRKPSLQSVLYLLGLNGHTPQREDREPPQQKPLAHCGSFITAGIVQGDGEDYRGRRRRIPPSGRYRSLVARLAPNPGTHRGQAMSAKTRASTIRAIKRDLAKGRTYAQCARRYGVSDNTIKKYLRPAPQAKTSRRSHHPRYQRHAEGGQGVHPRS